MRACLKYAVRQRVIPYNPAEGFEGPKAGEPEREFLTTEEIQALTKAECRYPVLKRAFLFSCLTGLRWSDTNKLIWKEIQSYNGIPRIVFRQKKTNGQEYLDINPQALELLGEQGNAKPEDRVFKGLKYSSSISLEIGKWCLRAGITKDITYHCSRHSFATMMFDIGEDIYTVKELLGHKDIKTTQIYTKVLDKKKQAAVSKIPQLLPTEKDSLINHHNLPGKSTQ